MKISHMKCPNVPGIFAVKKTTNPAPKGNLILTLIFAASLLGLVVNAVAFEPHRCTSVVSYGTKAITECGLILGSFACAKSDGSGTNLFDSSSCKPTVCTSVSAIEVVPMAECSRIQQPSFSCTYNWFNGECNKGTTSGWGVGPTSAQYRNCLRPQDLFSAGIYTSSETVGCRNAAGGDTCEGVIAREECFDFSSCEGFFNELVCPSVFEALGGAAGYASVVMGILATLYTFVAKYYAQKLQSGEAAPAEAAVEV